MATKKAVSTAQGEAKRDYTGNRESWGSIRQRQSGRFQASYQGPDGERHTAPHTFSTRTDARAWLTTQRAAIVNGTWKSPAQLEAEQRALDAATFGPYAEAWIAQRVTKDGKPLAPRTVKDYRRYLAHLSDTFGATPLHKLTPAMVRTWHAKRIANGGTQAGQEARFMHSVMATAVLDEIVARNPVDAKLTRTKTGHARRDITPDELAILLDEIGPRFYLAIILAAFAGLRTGEWRPLRRRDLTVTLDTDGNPTGATVRVERAAQYLTGQGWIVGPPKSAEGVRTVTLPDWAALDVATHLAEQVGPFPDSLIFAPTGSSEYVHDRQFRKDWNRAHTAASLGADVTPHSLRHHAGTQYAATGATLADIKARLGHSTTAAAMVYQHATNRDAELANRMPEPNRKPRSNVTPLPTTNTAAS